MQYVKTYNFPLENEITVDFEALNSRVRTSTAPERPSTYAAMMSSKNAVEANNWLIIEIEVTLEPYDSISESGFFARPRLLTLLGVMSYLMDYPILPRESTDGSTVELDSTQFQLRPKVIAMKVREDDHKDTLEKLLMVLTDNDQDRRRLLISVLDRFRRGLHFAKESEDEPVYDDEAFLSFFHALEIFAAHYSTEFESEARSKIERYVKDILSYPFLCADAMTSKTSEDRSKEIVNIIRRPEDFSAAAKLKFFLNRMGLLPEGMHELVGNLIRIRNDIAHGNRVHREDFIWLVPQFFPMSLKSYDYTLEIKSLAAKAIARWVGGGAWEGAWNQLEASLYPTRQEVKSFVKNKMYEGLSASDFVGAKLQKIAPTHVVGLYIGRRKDLTKAELSDCLRAVLLDGRAVADWFVEIAKGVCILADSDDSEVAERCRALIDGWVERPVDPLIKGVLREILRELQYENLEAEWLADFLREQSA